MKHLHFVFPDGMLKAMLPVGSAKVTYFGMPMGMWTLFAPSFRKQLTAVFGYDTDRAKVITKKAKPAYRKIIDGLPKFEKGDRFKMNLVNCAMIGAFILSMPEHPDVKRLNVVVNANAKTPYLAFLQTMRKKAADSRLYCQQPFCGQS